MGAYFRQFPAEARELLNLDGKVVRGTIAQETEKQLHLLALQAHETNSVVRQTELLEGENEISAAKRLLSAADLHDKIVSGDAIFAQQALSRLVTFGASCSQAELGYGNMNFSCLIGLYPVPLRQHIEECHRVPQAHLKILPYAVHDFLEMTDERQHREHRLHHHPVLPPPSGANCSVRRVTFRTMKSTIGQNNHLLRKLCDEGAKLMSVINIGGGTVPRHHETILIEQQAQFTADNPTVVRNACASDLIRCAPFADGVDE